MALLDGITKGQIWTGRNGMGPTVKIQGIDPGTSHVHYEYVSGTTGYDPSHPYGHYDLSRFISTYRPR